MKSTWLVWLVFSLSLMLVLSAMGWISAAALRSEATEAATLARSDFEEAVRTSLWRMENHVGPVIHQEAARPYFSFTPSEPGAVKYAGVTQPWAYVLLHFQLAEDGRLVSPELAKPEAPDVEKEKECSEAAATRRRYEELGRTVNWDHLAERVPRDEAPPGTLVIANDALAWNSFPPNSFGNNDNNRANRSDQQQSELNNQEFQARQQSVQRLAQGNFVKGTLSLGDVRVGAMNAVWIEDQLFLVRWMTLRKTDYLQGVWLDWPQLRHDLMELIQDKFPEASLQPLATASVDNPPSTLAGLRAEFLPNSEPLAIIDPLSPLRITLAVAWACALLASAAVGLLLFGVVRLSERRAAFVSAVTHELRTPLTTFRMYAEMLAGGMVRQPEKQREYLDTLRLESDRLSHLVENVLSYARLERGRSPRRLKGVAVPELMKHVEPRLRDRARQTGLELSIEIAPDATSLASRCDPTVVEQILLNLVDNACKYATGSSPAVIHLEAFARGKAVCLRVRDHGPGIALGDRSRVFEPFRKSAQEAAHSAPGVGLGLALCRRLARALGGNLRLEDHPAGGAALVLMLRRARVE